MAALTQTPVPAPIGSDIPTYDQLPETSFDCMCLLRCSMCSTAILKAMTNVHIPVVDWADLATLDLSQFDQPGGKEQLAKQLFDAIQKIG